MTLNPSRRSLTCGAKWTFVELDLEPYVYLSQSASLQRNRLL